MEVIIVALSACSEHFGFQIHVLLFCVLHFCVLCPPSLYGWEEIMCSILYRFCLPGIWSKSTFTFTYKCVLYINFISLNHNFFFHSFIFGSFYLCLLFVPPRKASAVSWHCLTAKKWMDVCVIKHCLESVVCCTLCKALWGRVVILGCINWLDLRCKEGRKIGQSKW